MTITVFTVVALMVGAFIGAAVMALAAGRRLDEQDGAILRLSSSLRSRGVPEYNISEAIRGDRNPGRAN